MLTYGDLFDHLEEKCDFRTKDGTEFDPEKIENVTWACDNRLTFTKAFCDEYHLNYDLIEYMLHKYGAWCDCEVLFNVTSRIDRGRSLERLD